MTNLDLSTTEIAIALAGGLVVACHVFLILIPAWRCYGRVWEKIAASFMTLFILATLLDESSTITLASSARPAALVTAGRPAPASTAAETSSRASRKER